MSSSRGSSNRLVTNAHGPEPAFDEYAVDTVAIADPKSCPVPPEQSLWTYHGDGFQDRGKPPIQLDKEQAIAVREPDPFAHLPPQDNQLLSKRGVLRFKPAPRPERRDQEDKDEPRESAHCRSR
jgi:hypothetical protein